MFPVITPDAWCGCFKPDADLVQARAIRSVTQHRGKTEYDGGFMRHVAGTLLNADELATNEAAAAEIENKRKAQ